MRFAIRTLHRSPRSPAKALHVGSPTLAVSGAVMHPWSRSVGVSYRCLEGDPCEAITDARTAIDANDSHLGSAHCWTPSEPQTGYALPPAQSSTTARLKAVSQLRHMNARAVAMAAKGRRYSARMTAGLVSRRPARRSRVLSLGCQEGGRVCAPGVPVRCFRLGTGGTLEGL